MMESAMAFLSGLFANLTLQSILVLVLVFLTAYWILGAGGRQENLPPGPRGLPLLGNLLSFRPSRLLSNLTAWRQKYGDVFCVRIANKLVVVLNGHKAIQDALVKQSDVFSDRPSAPFIDSEKDQGVAMSRYGEDWRRKRRLGLTALRQFGMGKRSLEAKITEEARAVCDVIAGRNGAATDMSILLNNGVANVICSMSFGNRFDYSDAEFQRLLRNISEMLRGTSTSAFVMSVRKVFFRKKYERGLRLLREVKDFIKSKIEEHRETFDPADIRDIIDVYLMETQHQTPDDDDNNISEKGMINTIKDFFIAGADTTTTTLRWGLLYLSLNPEVQRKVQAEIDREFGASPPSYSQRQNLPYTEATILEIQRIRVTVPLAVPHVTSIATKLRGFDIPAKTLVLPNLWSAMTDPEVTPDPEAFNPERFLDEAGTVVRPGWFIPFSVGRRQCLGEQLAKMELFLFMTTFLQHFTFKLPDGAPAPSTEGILGLTLAPRAYQICAVPRDK